jgi:chitin synthase
MESRRRPSELDFSSPVGYPETGPYVPFNAVPTPPIHDNTGASSAVYHGPPGPSAQFGSDAGFHQPPQHQHSELGLAPARQLRRYNTKKRVQLVRGNLVLDCPCPTRLLQAVPRKDAKEFTHMRYTAATCDPSEFAKDYTLRQALLGRSTELFIAVTMYNVRRTSKENVINSVVWALNTGLA